jgi:hypothetical protein
VVFGLTEKTGTGKGDWFSGKRSGFLFFTAFYTIFHFHEFCRTCYFEFFNSLLIKNLKIHSSFFRNFYFKISQNFNKFKFSRPIFGEPAKPVPTDFVGFHENQPIFDDIVIHGSWCPPQTI